jgi:arsenate reductase
VREERAALRVLILCTGNSARSQIAEGLLRHLGGDGIEAMSAGTHPAPVHPLAVRVMEERGIDIQRQRSKHVSEFAGQAFDYVITVCDAAAKRCPIFPGPARRVHWSIPDPATGIRDQQGRLAEFRRVREDLEERLRGWLAALAGDPRGIGRSE